jgi:hypothetical protein
VNDEINLKDRLSTARPGDFQIVKLDGDAGKIRWAVSLYGCTDIAWFLRKADAELFVTAWGADEMPPKKTPGKL